MTEDIQKIQESVRQYVPLLFEVLNAAGEVLGSAASGHTLYVETVAGDVYFLRISGDEIGQYVLDLFTETDETDPGGSEVPLPGDTDGDDDVDFVDFLTLSSNFGQATDAAFADGDFNTNGGVDFGDFLMLAANFGKQRSR